MAEAGLGTGPGPPGLREEGVGGWRQARPEGAGNSLINRMIGGRWTGSQGCSGHQPPVPRPPARPVVWGQGHHWPLVGVRLW